MQLLIKQLDCGSDAPFGTPVNYSESTGVYGEMAKWSVSHDSLSPGIAALPALTDNPPFPIDRRNAAMSSIPAELNLNGVYVPPWLLAALLGLLLAMVLARLANWTSLSRFVWHPPLFFAALVVACTVLVGSTLVPAFSG